MDNTWIIVITVIATTIVIIVVLLFLGYWYIKRKIQNRSIDVGASIITKIIIKLYPKIMKKSLDEDIENKIHNGTNVAKEILKGDITTTATVAIKGLKIAKQGLKEENRKKILDKGAYIITKAKEKYLNEKTTSTMQELNEVNKKSEEEQ